MNINYYEAIVVYVKAKWKEKEAADYRHGNDLYLLIFYIYLYITIFDHIYHFLFKTPIILHKRP